MTIRTEQQRYVAGRIDKTNSGQTIADAPDFLRSRHTGQQHEMRRLGVAFFQDEIPRETQRRVVLEQARRHKPLVFSRLGRAINDPELFVVPSQKGLEPILDEAAVLHLPAIEGTNCAAAW